MDRVKGFTAIARFLAGLISTRPMSPLSCFTEHKYLDIYLEGETLESPLRKLCEGTYEKYSREASSLLVTDTRITILRPHHERRTSGVGPFPAMCLEQIPDLPL